MKIARKTIDGREQYLTEHIKKVAKYSLRIGSKVGLGQTSLLIALLHDMGKLTPEFQEYIKNVKPEDKQSSGIDHGVYGAKYIMDKLAGNEIQKEFAEIIAFVICYHHGGLPDYLDKDYKITIFRRIKKIDDKKYQEIFHKFELMLAEPTFKKYNLDKIISNSINEFNDFKEKNKDLDKKSYIFNFHMLTKILYSILIDSDWYDSHRFEFQEESKIDNLPETVNLVERLDLYISNLEDKFSEFKKKKPETSLQKTLYDVRNDIASDCLKASISESGVFKLTVPTGGGKTLSSLYFALNHVKERKKERILFVAPYISIIEQNAKTIREILKCGDELLEFHSNVIKEEVIEIEKEKKVSNYFIEEELKVLSSRWDYPIVFTTMVQFLNVLYAKPSQDIRKLQSLINSVIVFDEAQAVPIHCITLFNEAINFLVKNLNCTVVLCTATQPALDKVARPIKLKDVSEIVQDVTNVYNKLKRIDVIDRRIKGNYSYEDVINLALELKDENKTILIIANTVTAATELFNLINESGAFDVNYYLSTRLCAKHRLDLINDMKLLLKKKDKSSICISTQVIECGVDISFDTVIRSLAGLDSIAQASGRCNREGESNNAKTYVINLKDELENTKRILNIEYGKIFVQDVLDFYKHNPASFNNSLLSTEAIDAYFRRFIQSQEVKKEFDYCLDKETTIFGLFSSEKYKSRYRTDGKYPLKFCYQFKTARSEFKVIEDNTKAIIVPYQNEGKEIIADLVSSKDLKSKYKSLQNSQPYTVNVYEYEFNKLVTIGAIVTCEVEGVNILKEGFYDEAMGLTFEKRMKPEMR